MTENNLTELIIGEAIHVHSDLGPGLLESVYEEVLTYRLRRLDLEFKRQEVIPIVYEEVYLEAGFRADIIIEGSLIVEIKSVEKLAPVHAKQLLTYLKLTGISVGLLLNFNEDLLKKGIKRLVNNFDPASSAPLRDPNQSNYG